MTRSFYSYAIFFGGIFLIINFFENIIQFQLEERVLELRSLASWLIFEFLISLFWSLILLKYYHYKQYWFTFWLMTVSIAASLFHFILLYNLLKTREISDNYIMATFVVLGMGILYSFSLIFSAAGKRPWLKAAGIFLFFLGLVMMSSFIWAISSVDVRLNGAIAKIGQWAALIACLAPVLFIMNFRSERETAEKAKTYRQRSFNGVMGYVAFIALASVLIFGSKLAIESIRLSSNPDNVSEYLKKLARPFEARTYGNNIGDTLQYRLMIPMDYDSTKKYPLVVCLHGSSGRGPDNVKQVATSLPAQLLSARENRTKYPAFLFVPQCPPKTCWGGIPNVPAVDSLVFEIILALGKEFAIDGDRCYVAGNSLGWIWHMAFDLYPSGNVCRCNPDFRGR